MALLHRMPISDRAHETNKLDSLCRQKPTAIRVVLGPNNCGKTGTLVSYMQEKKNIVYIDCRGIDTSSPMHFIQVGVFCYVCFMTYQYWYFNVCRTLSSATDVANACHPKHLSKGNPLLSPDTLSRGTLFCFLLQ